MVLFKWTNVNLYKSTHKIQLVIIKIMWIYSIEDFLIFEMIIIIENMITYYYSMTHMILRNLDLFCVSFAIRNYIIIRKFDFCIQISKFKK